HLSQPEAAGRPLSRDQPACGVPAADANGAPCDAALSGSAGFSIGRTGTSLIYSDFTRKSGPSRDRFSERPRLPASRLETHRSKRCDAPQHEADGDMPIFAKRIRKRRLV